MTKKTAKKKTTKKKRTKKPTPRLGGKHPAQVFTVATVHRKDLLLAKYNPRQISAAAKAKLKDNLGDVGLITPLCWNRRTGNLVAGHQRIRQLDSLRGGKKDYTLDVAVIDVDEKTEKRQNLFLNNPSSQGWWDGEKLTDLLREDPDLGALGGFDDLDLSALIDDPTIAPTFHPTAAGRAAAALAADVEQAIEDAGQAPPRVRPDDDTGQAETSEEDVGKHREQRAEEREKLAGRNEDHGLFVVVVCQDTDQADGLIGLLGGKPGVRYIDADVVLHQIAEWGSAEGEQDA